MIKASIVGKLFLGILFFTLEIQTVPYYSRPTRLEDGTYVWGYSNPLTKMEDGTYTDGDKQITFEKDGTYIVRFPNGKTTQVFPKGHTIENIFTDPDGTKLIVYSNGVVEKIKENNN